MSLTPEQIEHFLHGQLDAWNAHDKDGFFEHYRAVSPGGLDIDYVGQPARPAWDILEKMWTDQNDKVEVEVLKKIVNGTEAACLHRNHIRSAGMAIDTIELYNFGEGTLSIRYFIAAPHKL